MNDFIDKFNSVPTGQRVLGLILVMVGILVLFYFLLLNPVSEDIAQANVRLSELQREKDSLEALKRNRELVLVELDQLRRQLLIAQEKLPADAEIPSLLQRVHNQAKTAGLDIQRFERMPDVTKDYYIEIPVSMKLQGTFDELANFFLYVGRMTRIVNIRDISLQRTGGALSPEGELNVSAKATTFRYKDTPSGGKKK